jgi:hypothetical protein
MQLKLAILVLCISSVFGQEISISGYLDKKYLIDIPIVSLRDSVSSLTKSITKIDPNFPQNCFEFVGSDLLINKEILVFKNKNLSLIETLKYIASNFRYKVKYDLSRGKIVFTEVTETGDDPSRIYTISDETSKKLRLDWGSIVKFQKKLFSYGIVVDFHEIDEKNHLFRASGSTTNLDHIDMLIYVFSKIEDPKVRDLKVRDLKVRDLKVK